MKRIRFLIKLIIPLLVLMFSISSAVFYKSFEDSKKINYLLESYYLPTSSRINHILFDVIELSEFWNSTNNNVNNKSIVVKSLRILSMSDENLLQTIQLLEKIKDIRTDQSTLEILLDARLRVIKLRNYISVTEKVNSDFLITSLDSIIDRIKQISFTMSASLDQFYHEKYKTEQINLIYNGVLFIFFMIIYLPAMILLTRVVKSSLINEEVVKHELNQAMQKLKKQALYDSLTGLANRYLLYERLTQQLIQQKRARTDSCIFYLDLDKFKTINDTKGHEAGDNALVHAAKCMRSCVRETDTVARLGGDEFVVLFNNIDSRDSIAHVAEKILSRLREPIDLKGERFNISSSIGIHIIDDSDLENTNDIESVLKKADFALYYQKEHGRGGYSFYNEIQSLKNQ